MVSRAGPVKQSNLNLLKNEKTLYRVTLPASSSNTL
jgi:hypothetical protein